MTDVLSGAFREIDVDAAASEYAARTPFPHAVLDGAIDTDVLDAAIRSFPEVDGPNWTNYLHVNERKFGNSKYDSWPGPVQRLADGLMGDEFVGFLERLTGIDGLRVDRQFDGGGLHRSERGGYLNVHADYSKHHVHADWKRRVNVLLYLNDDWHEEWGGHLELWSVDMRTREKSIAPRANRMVIFSTTATAFHGHPEPLACPEGIARRSLALYYFTEGDTERARTTAYRARPDDGLRRIPIYLDMKVLRLYDIIKRRLGLSDDAVSKILSRISRRTRK